MAPQLLRVAHGAGVADCDALGANAELPQASCVRGLEIDEEPVARPGADQTVRLAAEERVDALGHLGPDLEAAGCLNETGNKNRSPSTTAAIIGAFEAQLAIDYFLGKTESAGKLYIYDNNEIRKLEIRSEKID